MTEHYIDLFAQAEMEQEPVKNPLGVVKNGTFVNMDWREIFDPSRYDEIKAVTYVSSPSFFAKAIEGFNKVSIIIGIEDSDFKSAFSESLRARMSKDGVKFFESLPDEYKEKVAEDHISIRYSDVRTLVHSKFYLLSNSQTGEKRIVAGSANFTQAAMDGSIKHYEDILVFDDDNYYQSYKERYEEISKVTVDYVPEDVKRKYKEGKLINLADFTAEERAADLFKIMKEQNIMPVCSEETIQQLQEESYSKQKELEELQATITIVSVSGKKSKKGDYYVLKPEMDARQKITDLLYKTTKVEEDLARFALTYNDADRKQYIVYPYSKDSESSRKMEVFDRQASTEEIRNSLKNLLEFVSAYKNMTHDPDPEGVNLSHIFEIIIYSFASAYIFKLRSENPGRMEDFPIMLVIGGRPSSGKSNLLAYIDSILSGRKLEKKSHYVQYKDIEGKKTLQNLYSSDNTYPLLVDEMSTKFFTSTARNKGEELIKYLANTLEGKHPVVICTTNTTAFHIPHQVERRIYYVQVNDCFDENMKGEADAFYERVMNECENNLFRDFCYRVGEKIKNGEKLTETGNSDYLKFVRDIFVEYFKEAGLEMPNSFPAKIFNDYERRGLNMWKTLFEKKPESFVYDRKKSTLSISGKDMEDKDLYMNYLRQDLLEEDAGEFIVLRKDKFLEWIGIDGWYQKRKAIKLASKQKI